MPARGHGCNGLREHSPVDPLDLPERLLRKRTGGRDERRSQRHTAQLDPEVRDGSDGRARSLAATHYHASTSAGKTGPSMQDLTYALAPIPGPARRSRCTSRCRSPSVSSHARAEPGRLARAPYRGKHLSPGRRRRSPRSSSRSGSRSRTIRGHPTGPVGVHQGGIWVSSGEPCGVSLWRVGRNPRKTPWDDTELVQAPARISAARPRHRHLRARPVRRHRGRSHCPADH